MINNEVINNFLENMKNKGINRNTYLAYKSDLELLSDYAGDRELLKQDKKFIEEYTNYLKENYKENNLYRKIASFKLFYKKQFEEGKIETLIIDDVKHYKSSEHIPQLIEKSEAEELYGVCGKSEKGIRDSLLMRILYETGIKLSEALSLEKSDIKDSTLVLKSKEKKHIIKLSQELLNSFDDYFALEICGSKKLFEGLTRQNFSAKVKRYGAEAGLGKEVTPVKLKNSAIYNFIEKGVSVRDLKEKLDYTNIGMSGIYKIRNKSEIKKIYESIAIGDWNVSEDI